MLWTISRRCCLFLAIDAVILKVFMLPLVSRYVGDMLRVRLPLFALAARHSEGNSATALAVIRKQSTGRT